MVRASAGHWSAQVPQPVQPSIGSGRQPALALKHFLDRRILLESFAAERRQLDGTEGAVDVNIFKMPGTKWRRVVPETPIIVAITASL